MRGTPAAYAALVEKDIDTLYFIAEPTSNEGCLYLGNKLIAGNGNNEGGDLSELLSLNDLTDVIVNSLDLTDASFLIYDKSQQAWVNCSKEALVFVGSSSSSNGKAGLVPAPMAGEENKFLRGDGTWADPVVSGEVANTTVYQVIAQEGESKENAIIRIVNGAILNKGDIVIVKVLITDDKFEHTAYVHDGSAWVAMDGNYSADNVYFKSDFIFTENVGTVKIPETGNVIVPAAGMNVTNFFNKLFSETRDPEIEYPTLNITLENIERYQEVGTTITPTYSIDFTSGSYEFGPADTGVVASKYEVIDSNGNTSNTISGSMPSVLIEDGTKYNISATVTYGDGVKAYNNLQNESEQYIQGNSIDATTDLIYGYRAAFAGMDTTTNIINSDLIRGLSQSWNYNTRKELIFDASTLEEKATRFIVAIPKDSMRSGLVDASIISSMNADCTNDYVLMDEYVNVKGANDYVGADYKVWIYAPASIGVNEVHKVILN